MSSEPLSPHSSVVDEPSGLTFIIPARKRVLGGIFIAVWLVGWIYGEVGAISELLSGSSEAVSFLVVWLAVWTVGGGAVIFALMWMLAGRERVTLTPPMLVLRHEVFGFGRTREYQLSSIRNLRTVPQKRPWRFRWQPDWEPMVRVTGGVIAFDYEDKTVRFGAALDETEGTVILKRMNRVHRWESTGAC